MKQMKLIGVVLGFMIIAFLVWIGTERADEKAKIGSFDPLVANSLTEPDGNKISISTEDLRSAYDENVFKADQLYKDKHFVVYGRFAGSAQNKDGINFITLFPSKPGNWIVAMAFFNSSGEKYMSNKKLNIGDDISLKCVGDGVAVTDENDPAGSNKVARLIGCDF